MPRSKKLLPLAIIGAAVVVMLGLAAMRSKPPQRPSTPRVPAVEVVIAEAAPGGFVVRAQGTVQPRTQTTLVSEVGGTVLEVSPKFVAGGFLRRGELLLRVDPKDYEVAVLRAEASLANRRALLAQENARAEQAAKDWASLKRPGQPNPLVLRTPYVAEAQANVRSAEADLAAAKINLERTRVKVPFDGLLREKRADVGQYVNVGAILGVFAATDVGELRLPLSEADLAVVELPAGAGVPIELTTRAGARSWPATLVRTEGVLDERTRVMYAVAEIADPYALEAGSGAVPLQFGSFVEARLPARLDRPVIAVPRHALRGLDQLLLVDAEDRLRLRTVEVLRADPTQVYVGSGLQVGERVVTTVVEAPVAGMSLRVLGGDAAAPAAAAADANGDGADAAR
jgi:RND family efflux transporter MFP subunit